MIRKIKERLCLEEEKIFLVQNGVETDRFIPIDTRIEDQLKKKVGFEGQKIILYAGRLVENKGAHILIEAFSKLQSKGARLVLAGGATYSNNSETEYIKHLRNLAFQKKDDILFLGFLPHKEMAEIFGMSDIFVLPSEVEEALPMSLIEAMAVELPVIGSERGGIPDLIEDGINGFLVKDYSNPEEWAKKIDMLLNDEQLCQKFGEKARAKIEQDFTWGKIATDITNLYSRV